MKRAYGFPLVHSRTEFGEIVYGEVYSEDGQRLGNWTSSSMDFLKQDLAKCAKDYEFHFLPSMPERFLNKVQGV